MTQAADLPTGTTYSKFLSDNHLGDADAHAMMALELRRENMQTYQASLITSPTYQVLARAITYSTLPDAQKALKQLKVSDADFGKLATKSFDSTSGAKGMTDVMAELVGPARCKADILHGCEEAWTTFGPPRADSMTAREEYFSPQRPYPRVHPTGFSWTNRLLPRDLQRSAAWLWMDSG